MNTFSPPNALERNEPERTMDQKLNDEMIAVIKASETRTLREMRILLGVFLAVCGYMASDGFQRLASAEKKGALTDTAVAILQTNDANRSAQISSLIRSAEEAQRNYTAFLTQITELRVTLTTVRETTKAMSDRLEVFGNYLRATREPQSLLDNSNQIDRRFIK